MSSLDVPTAVLCAMVTRAVLALALVFYGSVQKTYRGFHWWTAGACVGALGILSLALRPSAPGASVILVNGLSSAGVLMLLDGTLRFVHGRPLDLRWYLVPLAITGVNAWFYFGVDDILVRTWVFMAAATAIAVAHAMVLLRGAPGASRRLYRAAAGLHLAYAASFIARAVRWSLGPAPAGILEAGPPEAAFFLFLCAADLASLTFFTMMNGQRLEAHLSASQDRLRGTLEELRNSLHEVKLLSGMLPICSRCKKIRDPEGHWHPVEVYVRERSDADFSHSVCEDCLPVLYPGYVDLLVDGR